MPPVYGGFGGDVSVQDVGGYAFSEPPVEIYSYTVPGGVISGIDQPTTFTGERAHQVESFVAEQAREYEPGVYATLETQKHGVGQYVAEGVYPILDPIYGTGGALEPVTAWVDPSRSVTDEFITPDLKKDVLLYGALAIGALALLKR